jgi:hypothetical protein
MQKNKTYYVRSKTVCKDCNNAMRRQKYKENPEHREKLIQMAIVFKRNKAIERRAEKQTQLNELHKQIGEENAICKYCKEVKPKISFRKNRLKCKDCERDVPIEKFKRSIRGRIYNSLIRKTKHTIDYLGCNTEEYLQWISDNANDFTMENHGELWHIDHVIPLSKFDLEDDTEQLLAFNWRNTMALSKKENLSKNNKIDNAQIYNHYSKLIEYHNKHNIIMPQEYYHLFAKHLDAGSPLEPLLPLSIGNYREELG